MARKVFYSFHFDNDCWRTQQVRNMGTIEGNKPCSSNDWEEVKKKGDAAVYSWIDNQLDSRTCTIVLIGQNTAGRKYINYEIKRSWEKGIGVVGVHIHGLKDNNQEQSSKGSNPFNGHTSGGRSTSSYIKVYDPPFSHSENVYGHISSNLAAWVEEAIALRAEF